ncbi:MAG: hypothetical protein H7Z38_12295 [Rubrivivax sp.]|nr:hypothetical protein [Pyrinomonadaceae bacterium]
MKTKRIGSIRSSMVIAGLVLALITGYAAARLNPGSAALAVAGSDANSSPEPAAQDTIYTGIWKGDDGATYYVRYVGTEIWWFGRGSGFGNVFHGRVVPGAANGPRRIVGKWADVPLGNSRNSGELTLTVASPTRFIVEGEPGNFGAREFKKQ